MAGKIAFILAGGLGERLRPITDEIPKPLIEINGKPILQYNIELAKNNGAECVVLGVSYKAEKIRDYFGHGEELGVEIKYSCENEPLGTGGALKQAEVYLQDCENFIMMNGDEMKEVYFDKLREVHTRNIAIATLALTEIEDPTKWGVVKQEGEKLVQFVSKPKVEDAPSRLINAGAYILSHDILDYIPAGKVSIENEVFPNIAAAGKLFGVKAVGQWYPTDTPEQLETARKSWGKSV